MKNKKKSKIKTQEQEIWKKIHIRKWLFMLWIQLTFKKSVKNWKKKKMGIIDGIIDKVPNVSTCCCCINLRIGGLIIGILELVSFTVSYFYQYHMGEQLYFLPYCKFDLYKNIWMRHGLCSLMQMNKPILQKKKAFEWKILIKIRKKETDAFDENYFKRKHVWVKE